MESLEEISKAREAASKASTSGTQQSADKGQNSEPIPPNYSPRGMDAARVSDVGQSADQSRAPLGETEASKVDHKEPTPFPQLSRRPLTSLDTSNDDDEEPNLARSFERSASPIVALQRNKGAFVEKVGEDGVSNMHKFSLYETATYFYIVGGDLLDQRFRILKIDRSEPEDLNVAEDDIVYTKKETNQILNAIDEGNRNSGGLKLRASFWGLLGFIRFTGAYYMLFVTKRNQVAMIGGHYIYQVDATEMVPLTTALSARPKADKHPEEPRFVGILNNLDLSRSFYFSYSYDVTRTLQHNIMRERQALQDGLAEPMQKDHNDMFVWNHHLLEPARKVLNNTYDWCLSIVHGYVDQAALSVYWGRVVYITIIARRSRFFAGARYLKRGANDLGYVANDVETEQIVSEMLTTSFHAPGPSLYANPNYTSYVQHRGSIPLHWTQESAGVSPKPDIELNLVDPFYSAAALHFDNLFYRYGAPVYVLDLVKAKERIPRESKLLNEYTSAITYLNQFLPDNKKIVHHAFDMSRASKSRDQDVIGSLEAIAEEIVPRTGFFQNGDDIEAGLKLQNGVARTNCIDCLDRTNAAQFVIGKKALGHQLYALGVLDDPNVEYDSDAVNLFTHMWHDHGDTIAVQYGGSHLVNTMATYRKINQWTSHSRDMVESFKRYVNNSFLDAQRQDAYNLFLGNYVFAQGQPMLWDLSSDYYLHHSDPRAWFGKKRKSYRDWFTPDYLQQPSIPPAIWPQEFSSKSLQYFDDYWLEYYRPLAVSSFKKIYSFKMHSNLRYIPIHSTQDGRYDLSPFKVRSATESDPTKPNKGTGQRRKGVQIVTPSETSNVDTASSIDARISSPIDSIPAPKPIALGPWLDAQQLLYAPSRQNTGTLKGPSFEQPSSQANIASFPPSTPFSQNPTKAEHALQAFTSMVANSLDPSVPYAEEYERWITHPLNLPLVISSEIDHEKRPPSPAFLEYLGKAQEIDGIAAMDERAEESLEQFADFLKVGDEGLTVLEEDSSSKRYKRYRQWLRGKSLFKQRPIGGEAPEEMSLMMR